MAIHIGVYVPRAKTIEKEPVLAPSVVVVYKCVDGEVYFSVTEEINGICDFTEPAAGTFKLDVKAFRRIFRASKDYKAISDTVLMRKTMKRGDI